MASILLRGGRIFDGTDFFMGDLLIDGTQIPKIAPHIDADANFTFDATGKLVLPGLTDIHMHIRGLSSPKWRTPVDSGCLSRRILNFL